VLSRKEHALDIKTPELALIVLIGASGSGKLTFARRHFLPTEVISSDECRALVADDENDQSATKDAFEILHFIAAKRLAAGRLTVVDATNTQPEARKPLVELARRYHCLPVAIVLDVPERVCHERNATRENRNFGTHVVRNQREQLRRSLGRLQREGFRHVFVLRSVEEIESATLVREPLWNNKKSEVGPFDIIGDVHGCYDELTSLLAKLGYVVDEERRSITHASGRRAVFVGDLVDRGPRNPEVLKLVMNAVTDGTAFCVAGNHDVKLSRKLRGREVKVSHGLAESLAQLESETDAFKRDAADFLDGLVSHYVFDHGKLVVAHAGLKEEMQGRGSGAVRTFSMYGDTTGETDEFGLPVRYNWAADYRGRAMVVYGHTPVPAAEWLNNTICIDTGCVFGGQLTALRYPERELVSVPAARVHYEPLRPLQPQQPSSLTAQQQHDDVLDIEDVVGKRFIETSLDRRITIREENGLAALEVMSRFAANPKWLVYLPPTMSPSQTHTEGSLLEHPQEAFAYFQRSRIDTVVCEEKHMGSRAIVVVCRDEANASASSAKAAASSTRARDVAFSTMQSWRVRSWNASRPHSKQRASSMSSTPIGSCSTASCCRGPRKRKTCCVNNTRRSVLLPALHCARRSQAWRRRGLPKRISLTCTMHCNDVSISWIATLPRIDATAGRPRGSTV
jgi:protein phosphatase